MAAASGSPYPHVEPGCIEQSCPWEEVEGLLRGTPYEFEFFQLVRLMEKLRPAAEPVGTFADPSKEVVRFTANPAVSFPASQIQRVDWAPDKQPSVTINFMGLNGPSGVLPLYYSELINERLRAKDSAPRAFLDIFNHRIVSLFYQAWEKYRFPIAYERGERDRFTHHLLDLLGLGTPGLEDRQDIPDESLLYYAGLLSLQPRSAAALEQILEDYFEVPVEVEQFVGAWHALDPETQCRFDKANSYSEQLGFGAVVGDEIWDQQSGVRIRLGPLSFDRYLDFLPEGIAHKPIRALTRFFGGDGVDFELQLILKREETPRCELGEDGTAAPRLGWTSWAASKPLGRDPADTVLPLGG
jgi:type VI secretion system protein ImpH